MPLNIKTKIVHHVTDGDLDKFVHEYFGNGSYCFAADYEAVNDTSYTFHVPPITDTADDQRVQEFRDGNPSCAFVTGSILDTMCKEGAIPPGEYLVTVSW